MVSKNNLIFSTGEPSDSSTLMVLDVTSSP